MILTTKYLGPTNTQGSCVLVYCGADKAKRIAWDHALDANENHEAAAIAIAERILGRKTKLRQHHEHGRILVLRASRRVQPLPRAYHQVHTGPMTPNQPASKQIERALSEQRNIILARSRLALLYARRGQISQSMVDAIGVVLDAQSKEVFTG